MSFSTNDDLNTQYSPNSEALLRIAEDSPNVICLDTYRRAPVHKRRRTKLSHFTLAERIKRWRAAMIERMCEQARAFDYRTKGDDK